MEGCFSASFAAYIQCVVARRPFSKPVAARTKTPEQIETSLAPREVLDRLLEIEQELGRVRDVRWGPRPVDLDLLVYGDERVEEDGLHVPHARLHERRFALEPLAELDPELEIPGFGSVSALLDGLDQ